METIPAMPLAAMPLAAISKSPNSASLGTCLHALRTRTFFYVFLHGIARLALRRGVRQQSGAGCPLTGQGDLSRGDTMCRVRLERIATTRLLALQCCVDAADM